jgi:3-dehydroquinate synthetase
MEVDVIPTEIVIGRGCIDAATVLGDAVSGPIPILTQPGAADIARLLADSASEAGLRTEVLTLEDGEAAKSLGAVEAAARWLAELGVRRDGVVVGVGGGSVTDVAGFVAGVYLRGVGAVYVPTTLLGAVDAAIGGKTGVNVDGKNIVGVFRHPRRVVVDADILEALPSPIRRHGFAEALKAGLVGDPGLVDRIEAEGLEADVEEVVRRSVAVKAAIVGRDFEEAGERAHLNYGHTVGHALEAATGMHHGEAVAVGMVAAGRVSALVAGFDDEERQRAIIAALGLPITAPAADTGEVMRHLGRDKKRDAEGLRMVVLSAVGAPRVVHVDAATVGAALGSIGLTGGDT